MWGVAVVTVVLNLGKLKVQSHLGHDKLVLEVGQLGVVSFGFNRGNQLLDDGFLVLHNGHFMRLVGGFELKKKTNVSYHSS